MIQNDLQPSRGYGILPAGVAPMLKLLKINNIALVSSLELEFGSGLTLLTGETGAGKSILIDALGLLLGARATSDLIRTGERLGSAEAIVEGPGIRERLEAHGLPTDGDEAILRREVSAAGKGRATVNGALAPVSLLRDLAPLVATIHGQHEPQGLLDPETHVDLLDGQGGLFPLRERVALCFQRLTAAEAALEALRRDRREWERRRESLEYQVAEISRAGLTPGEEEDLRREKVLQANAGRLASLSDEAYAALFEDEAAILTRLSQVQRRVEDLAAIDPRFVPHVETGPGVRAPLEDLALFLRDYREALTVTPGRLDEIESRLALLERLKRKYGATVEEILAFAERSRLELESQGSPEEREKTLELESAQATAAYLAAGRELSAKRRSTARELERKVRAELADLAMEKTRFQVLFEPPTVAEGDGRLPYWTAKGLERVEFLLSPNPGEELRPLARIASGGELSRIMLALQSVATTDEHAGTLVFDEVDAGIGGRVAEMVGRKLRVISRRHQVLCVTHLPQIAGMADQHYAVAKQVERGRTITQARALDRDERIEEIARMLGGETVSPAARAHASEMLKHSLKS